jgi:carbonic anhydrase
MTSTHETAATGRRTVLRAGAAALLGLALPASMAARSPWADESTALSPSEALARLIEGNQRFREGRAEHPKQSAERRLDVAGGQHPFAAVLGCVDSRVPPETVFDQGLGDLFVVRVAGNIVDPAGLGSIQFGIEEYHIPLILVLGHSRCGAVIATIEAVEHDQMAPGQIGVVVQAIRPAVEEAAATPGNRVSNAVLANIRNSVVALRADPFLAEHLASGAVQIVGAEYNLESGDVRLVA